MQNNDISIPEDKKKWQIIQLSDGKSLQYTTVNARIIEIHSDCFIEESYLEHKELGIQNIHSLNFSDVYKIEVGNEFNTKILDRELKYKVGYITKLTKGNYLLITHLRNRSSIYLLPILGGIKEQYLYDWHLINCYIGIDNTYTEDYIYLLYRFIPGASAYLRFENEIKKHPLFIGKKDYKEYVIYKFSVPDFHKKDIKLFHKGKYSKLSDKLKKKIIDFHTLYEYNEFGHKVYNANSAIIGTLYKSPLLKEKMEKSLDCYIDETLDLDSIPDPDDEILL